MVLSFILPSSNSDRYKYLYASSDIKLTVVEYKGLIIFRLAVLEFSLAEVGLTQMHQSHPMRNASASASGADKLIR
jgi:hypothetical protein